MPFCYHAYGLINFISIYIQGHTAPSPPPLNPLEGLYLLPSSLETRVGHPNKDGQLLLRLNFSPDHGGCDGEFSVPLS